MSDEHEFHIEINVYVRAKEPGSAALCRREFEKVIPLKGTKNASRGYFPQLCEDSLSVLRDEVETLETLIIGGEHISADREAALRADFGDEIIDRSISPDRLSRLKEDVRKISPREAVDALIKEARQKDDQEPPA